MYYYLSLVCGVLGKMIILNSNPNSNFQFHLPKFYCKSLVKCSSKVGLFRWSFSSVFPFALLALYFSYNRVPYDESIVCKTIEENVICIQLHEKLWSWQKKKTHNQLDMDPNILCFEAYTFFSFTYPANYCEMEKLLQPLHFSLRAITFAVKHMNAWGLYTHVHD